MTAVWQQNGIKMEKITEVSPSVDKRLKRRPQCAGGGRQIKMKNALENEVFNIL